MEDITYNLAPQVTNDELNALFSASWPEHGPRDFQPVLTRSLTYVCARAGERLAGFVNLAWDGGIHTFLLDTTVHPDFQRRGIGTELVRRAVEYARERRLDWVHVDFEPHLEPFYLACGFRRTLAALYALDPDASELE